MSEGVSNVINQPAGGPAVDEGVKRRASVDVGSMVTRGSLIFVLLLLVVVFAAINGSTFFSGSTFKLILSTQASVGVVALAVTVASVAGQVDLSVAAVMGGSAAIVAMKMSEGAHPAWAIFLALVYALAFGIINGVLVSVLRMQSIISTLASGTIATGIGLALVGPNTFTTYDAGFLNLFSSTFGGLQTAFYLLVILTVVAVVVLQWTLLGRRLFFVGQNPEAAALLGIKVRRLSIGAMIAAALLAGFAGVMLTGQNGGAGVTQTGGYLLPAFAATFLGTSAIVPGRFNAVGTFIATYVLGTASMGLNMAGVPQWSTYLFNGGLLIISLAAFEVVKLRKARAAKVASMKAALESSEADGPVTHA